MRYKRQSILPEIGESGQVKLSAARVLVIGAGGLGCPVLLYLAAAGVGTIGIVDHDSVDISNLQRQVLFTAADCGRPKAVAAQERLRALNPEIEIVAYAEELTDKNVIGLFSGYDIIIDGTDNFPVKFLINDAAFKLGHPVVYAAIQAFEAQISVFGLPDGPCYRCLHPQQPNAAIMNCAESGIIGAVAGMAGTMQAMEAIKIIVGHDSFRPLSGRLLMIDARTMEINTIKIPRRADCPVCSRPREQVALRYASPVCAAVEAIQEISCDADIPSGTLFIDVRERTEWDDGHIEGAIHLPLSALRLNADLFTPPETGRACIVYCRSGRRSAEAIGILIRAGHAGLYNLAGGFEAWKTKA